MKTNLKHKKQNKFYFSRPRNVIELIRRLMSWLLTWIIPCRLRPSDLTFFLDKCEHILRHGGKKGLICFIKTYRNLFLSMLADGRFEKGGRRVVRPLSRIFGTHMIRKVLENENRTQEIRLILTVLTMTKALRFETGEDYTSITEGLKIDKVPMFKYIASF